MRIRLWPGDPFELDRMRSVVPATFDIPSRSALSHVTMWSNVLGDSKDLLDVVTVVVLCAHLRGYTFLRTARR